MLSRKSSLFLCVEFEALSLEKFIFARGFMLLHKTESEALSLPSPSRPAPLAIVHKKLNCRFRSEPDRDKNNSEDQNTHR